MLSDGIKSHGKCVMKLIRIRSMPSTHLHFSLLSRISIAEMDSFVKDDSGLDITLVETSNAHTSRVASGRV